METAWDGRQAEMEIETTTALAPAASSRPPISEGGTRAAPHLPGLGMIPGQASTASTSPSRAQQESDLTRLAASRSAAGSATTRVSLPATIAGAPRRRPGAIDDHGQHLAEAANVDGAARELPRQQDGDQIRLGALLASTRTFDPAYELRMLLHKWRLLESAAKRHGTAYRPAHLACLEREAWRPCQPFADLV